MIADLDTLLTARHQRPELYQLLLGKRGWSPERYEQFLADAWRRLLLAG